MIVLSSKFAAMPSAREAIAVAMQFGWLQPVSCMGSAEVIRLLEADGWCLVRSKGSHWHFKHPSKRGLVTVPHPKKDLPTGTLKSIEKQSGLSLT